MTSGAAPQTTLYPPSQSSHLFQRPPQCIPTTNAPKRPQRPLTSSRKNFNNAPKKNRHRLKKNRGTTFRRQLAKRSSVAPGWPQAMVRAKTTRNIGLGTYHSLGPSWGRPRSTDFRNPLTSSTTAQDIFDKVPKRIRHGPKKNTRRELAKTR